MEIQSRGVGLSGPVMHALQARFGGFWFDQQAGRFKVVVRSRRGEDPAAGESADRIRSETARRNVQDHTDIVGARSSWGDLEAARDSLVASLEDLLLQQKVRVGLDASRNAVRIEVSKAAGSLERDRVDRAAAASTTDAYVIELSRSEMHVKTTSCAFVGGIPACNRPLRIPSRIRNRTNGRPCSMGFWATSGLSRYVVTAGHCLRNLNNTTWEAIDSDFPTTPYSVGPTSSNYFNWWGDAGLTNVTNTHWNQQSYLPYAVVPNNTEWYPIRGRAWSFQGQVTCHLGYRSWQLGHLFCGTVQQTGQTATVDNGDGTTTVVGGQTVVNACSLYGDSGGAWVSYNVGHGIQSSGSMIRADNTGCDANPHSYFQELPDAEARLGVTVLTQ